MRVFPRRSRKAGLPPGTPIHVGERPPASTTISVIDYTEAGVEDREVTTAEACYDFRDSPTVTWINVEGVADVETVRKLGEHFGVHPLVLEDIVNTGQRPKLEDHEHYLYIVLKMLALAREGDDQVQGEQVSLVLGPNFLISFQEGLFGDAFGGVRERIHANRGRVRKSGSDYLAYALLDAIVDGYFTILEQKAEKIEQLDEAVIDDPSPGTLQSIQHLKREMILLRKSIWPLRDVITRLERDDVSLVNESTRLYMRDVHDHTVQVIEGIELFRDMLATIQDIYLSSISNRMNEVMKVLTIYATIFIPLTFLAGVYGMNFEYMPELKQPWAYPAVWLIMLAIAGAMLTYFRRKKWL